MAAFPDTDRYRIASRRAVSLADWATDDDGGLSKSDAQAATKKLIRKMSSLQERMYAQDKHRLLVVLQAMDAAGKDSTVRKVFGPLNPAGVAVTSFKAPSKEELAHDYLWRIHEHVPPRGRVAIFNRSHYEDVLVVRVKDLVPETVWRKRYTHINGFEKLLADEGTTILKFYLHVSKDYQKQRLQRRLDRPDKHWKFNVDDLAERARWDDYRAAFEEVFSRCAGRHAPWYIIPAEKRWFRDWLIARVVVEHLESLNMQLPEPTFDPSAITIE